MAGGKNARRTEKVHGKAPRRLLHKDQRYLSPARSPAPLCRRAQGKNRKLKINRNTAKKRAPLKRRPLFCSRFRFYFIRFPVFTVSIFHLQTCLTLLLLRRPGVNTHETSCRDHVCCQPKHIRRTV